MTLGRKLTYVRQHVESIFRHDDESIDARRAAAERIKAMIDAELAAADERHAAQVAAALTDKG